MGSEKRFLRASAGPGGIGWDKWDSAGPAYQARHPTLARTTRIDFSAGVRLLILPPAAVHCFLARCVAPF